MSSRLVGAVLALTAAALLAVSIWTSALRAGSPTIVMESGPRTIDKKTVYIGALGAQGCNTGGDEQCVGVRESGQPAAPDDKRLPPLKPAFSVIRLSVLATHGLLALLLLTLAALSFAKSDARKPVAKVAIVAGIVAGATTIVFIAYGDVFMEHVITVPIGYGAFFFGGALVGTIIAAILAPKVDPPPRPRPSRTPSQPRMPAPPPQPEFNVEALFAPDPPQSPSPSYPPPMGAPGFAPFANGPQGPNANGPYDAALNGPAPGFMPHGPNRPMNPNAPMGANAPMNPMGANAPMNPMGANAPTMMGNGPAPIPGTSPRQVPVPFGPPPPASPGGMLPGPAGPLGASSAPMFGEQPTFSPPALPHNRADGDLSAAVPPGPRTKQASVVPPPRGKPTSIAPPIPGLPVGPRPKAPSLAPPPFKVPTIPPFIAAGSAPGGPALPGLPPVTPQPDETTDSEALALRAGTDSEALALRAGTNAGMGVNEHTDMTATPISDEDAGAAMHTPPVDRESASDLAETTARPKMDPEELEATNDIGKLAAAFKAANASSPANHSDEAVTTTRRDGVDVHAGSPRPESKPARRDSKPAIEDDPDALAKIPVTTASEDLPPPKDEKAAAGPQPACPQCEAPMAWVEEHLRFYCKSCRMYF